MNPPRDKLIRLGSEFVQRWTTRFGFERHADVVNFGRTKAAFSSVAFPTGCYSVFPVELKR
eukprot:scaffold8625_cov180-Alexandrium_tamarense.AAC.10